MLITNKVKNQANPSGIGGPSDVGKTGGGQQVAQAAGGSNQNQTPKITPKTNKINADDLFKQVDYDPNGSHEYTNAILNPIDAISAKDASEDAIDLTRKAFPNVRRAWNNEADAFRHAVWNYLMTKEIGAEEAKKFADAHERYSGNKLGETTMDLFNNNVGRTLGSNPKFKPKDATRVILRAIGQGMLRVKPFEITGGGKNVEQDY